MTATASGRRIENIPFGAGAGPAGRGESVGGTTGGGTTGTGAGICLVTGSRSIGFADGFGGRYFSARIGGGSDTLTIGSSVGAEGFGYVIR